jgi:hypothetical protein
MARIETGISSDRYGFRAIVNSGNGRAERRFPRGTDVAIMRRWRQETKVKFRFVELRRSEASAIPALPKGLEGWCYIYVIGGTDVVKIGRTMNPVARLKDLQTGHDVTLTLYAAVPAHASLEPVLHERFAHLRTAGEWFALTEETAAFIRDLQAGQNPVNWVWNLERRTSNRGEVVTCRPPKPRALF